jgi:hypothetical protein
MPCGDYTALRDLHDETVHNCPDPDSCESCGSKSPSRVPPPSKSPSRTPFESNDDKTLDVVDITKLSLSHTSRYACCRASLLVCPNQGLANELDVVRRSRSLEGEDRSALSYARAIAVSYLKENVFLPCSSDKQVSYRPSKVGSVFFLLVV